MEDENKYSYERYDKCKICKHEDEICDCTMYKPLDVQLGFFNITKRFYSPDYQPKD